MSEVHLRAMEERDLDLVAAAELELFSEPWSRRLYEEERNRTHDRCYLVAELDGEFVGWAGISTGAGEGHVMTLATLSAFQRRGIGRLLLAGLVEAARALECSKVILEVAVSNSAAQALYRAAGFAPVGVRRKYYERSGEDALVMILTLEEHVA